MQALIYKVVVNKKKYVSATPVFKISGMKKNALNAAWVYVGRSTADGSHVSYERVKDINLPVKPTKPSKLRFRNVVDDGTFWMNGPSISDPHKVTIEIWSAYGKPKKLKTINRTRSYSDDSYEIQSKHLARLDYFAKNKFLKRVTEPKVSFSAKKYGWFIHVIPYTKVGGKRVSAIFDGKQWYSD